MTLIREVFPSSNSQRSRRDKLSNSVEMIIVFFELPILAAFYFYFVKVQFPTSICRIPMIAINKPQTMAVFLLVKLL